MAETETSADAKAEDTEANGAGTEPSKDGEVKADEAENSPTEEAKVEPDAAKPDAAKPDAAKPDAAKPDAAKPDAAKPDAVKPKQTEKKTKVKPTLSPAKAIAAKRKKKDGASATQVGGDTPQRDGEEPPKSAQQVVQENLAAFAVVGLLVLVAWVWWSYGQGQQRNHSQAAWAALDKVKRESKGTDGFEKVYQAHKGTSADPFIRIAWASRLYESGRRDEVERARDLLKQVLADNPGDDSFIFAQVKAQIEKISAELEDKDIPWPKKKDELAEDDAAAPAPLEVPGDGSLPGE